MSSIGLSIAGIKWNPVLGHRAKFFHNFPRLGENPGKNFPTFPIIAHKFPVVNTEIIDCNL